MKRSLALQLSLLASLGLLPFACAETTRDPDPSGGGTGGTGAGEAGSPQSMDHAGEGGAATRAMTRGCTNPQPSASGLVWCAKEGYYARPAATACADTSRGGTGGDGTLPRAPDGVRCEDDADCTAYDRGYCSSSLSGAELNFLGGGGGAGPDFCRSGCSADADCKDAEICVCNGENGGVCVPSDCRTNAGCGDGLLCASVDMGCGSLGFLCQSEADECATDADCESRACAYDPWEGTAARTCGGVICGRPFLVESAPRVAPAVDSNAWCSSLTPRMENLTPAERATQAGHWTKLGQMEHASIAAFARFALQLLALGAPADLVQACNQALIDETAHTRLCFGLASAYAGRDIGPGPLDVSRSLDVTSLADIVDLVIAEGCIGETNAALEALNAADAATDPVIRGAYARIAADEQRHAELAFRFVQWALQRDSATTASHIHAALTRAPAGACDVAGPCLKALLEARRAA